MTPKEKADNLVSQYRDIFVTVVRINSFVALTSVAKGCRQDENPCIITNKMLANSAKQCALIAIDEMIVQNGELYLNGISTDYYREVNSFLFQVKTEIEKL